MHRSSASYVLLHRPLIARATRYLPPTTGHPRPGMRRTRCHSRAAALVPLQRRQNGHVHGGSPESRHVDAVARGTAPLACGGGSSRRHASASACDCEQHHRSQPRTAPASHRSPAHRAAPRKQPGPPLPHQGSSLPCVDPRRGQRGIRKRFRQAPQPLPPYGDAGSLASDAPAARQPGSPGSADEDWRTPSWMNRCRRWR
jgi:hypothetical protein